MAAPICGQKMAKWREVGQGREGSRGERDVEGKRRGHEPRGEPSVLKCGFRTGGDNPLSVTQTSFSFRTRLLQCAVV